MQLSINYHYDLYECWVYYYYVLFSHDDETLHSVRRPLWRTANAILKLGQTYETNEWWQLSVRVQTDKRSTEAPPEIQNGGYDVTDRTVYAAKSSQWLRASERLSKRPTERDFGYTIHEHHHHSAPRPRLSSLDGGVKCPSLGHKRRWRAVRRLAAIAKTKKTKITGPDECCQRDGSAILSRHSFRNQNATDGANKSLLLLIFNPQTNMNLRLPNCATILLFCILTVQCRTVDRTINGRCHPIAQTVKIIWIDNYYFISPVLSFILIVELFILHSLWWRSTRSRTTRRRPI